MTASTQGLLAIYDISGIQEYIFASNRLRENVGASRIVGEILKNDLPEVMKTVADQALAQVKLEWYQRVGEGKREAEESFDIAHKDSILAAEIVYIGGGSAIVAYRDRNYFQQVNVEFAKRIIETTYTLSMAVAHIETSFGKSDQFGTDRMRLEGELERVKAGMLRQRPAGAFPISEQESFGGLPVTSHDRKSGEGISTVQSLKRQAADDERPKVSDASSHFNEIFPLPKELKGLKCGFEMKDMVRSTGEDGYVAVVHIDGNGMGQQLKNKMEVLQNDNVSYAQAVVEMRKLSLEISEGYRENFYQVIKHIACVDSILKENMLPIRPLIMDGDDLTFICRADLAVPMAAAFLQDLESTKLKSDKQDKRISLSACAGIAIVHSHFPFSIAYDIAEECCKEAKKKRHKEKECHRESDSYLDFHLVRGSYVQQLKDIRKNLTSKKNEQHGRPYLVSAPKLSTDPMAADSFNLLHTCLERIQGQSDQESIWPSTWLNRLYREYLANGEKLDIFIDELRSRNLHLKQLYQAKEQNNVGQLDYAEEKLSDHPHATIFDALELIDLYKSAVFSLDGVGETQ